MNRIFALGLVVMVLGGCVGPFATSDPVSPSPSPTTSLPWNVDIVVVDVESQENGNLHAYAVTGGMGASSSLEGVDVILLDEEMEVVQEIPVGNFSGVGERKHFNTTVPTLPLYVTVKIDEIDVSQPRNGHINGKYIDEDGEIDIYRVVGYENYTR